MYVNEAEIAALTNYLNQDLHSFKRNYINQIESSTEPGTFTNILKKSGNSTKDKCVFLDDKDQCSVYESRPLQCRTYPFWSQNLVGESEWKSEAEKCEGIHIDTLSNTNANNNDYIIKDDTVIKNMVAKSIHNGAKSSL